MEPEAIVPFSAVQVTTWDQLWDEVVNGTADTIEVMQDLSSFGALNNNAIPIQNGRNVTITSSGGPFTISQVTNGQRHFQINNGILTLLDITLDGQLDPTNPANLADPTIRGGVAFGTGAATRQLYMDTGSVITGNRATQGGGVFMVGNQSLLTMSGNATISNNAATGPGGGVSATGGSTFIMNNGDIAGNRAATNSGGVQVAASTFTMVDGTIQNNNAATGGGIFMNGSSPVTMQGGLIQGNVVTGNGGGVSVTASSTFTMTGGTIYNNSASDGGGVIVLSPDVGSSTFNMQGGLIDYNNATGVGGGVHLWGSESMFTMEAGSTLSRNTAGNSGGGVNVQGEGTIFTMNGGTISGNNATSNNAGHGGGGVNIHSGTFIMNNGTIQSNSTNSNGGGVRRSPTLTPAFATFNMNGGTIQNNTAAGDGGGLYAQFVGAWTEYRDDLLAGDYPEVTISASAVFSGNRAGQGAFGPPNSTITVSNRIATTNATLFGCPFNNFDINYRLGTRVTYLRVIFQTYLPHGSFTQPAGNPAYRYFDVPVDTPAGTPFVVPANSRPTEITEEPGYNFTNTWLLAGSDPEVFLTNTQVDNFVLTAPITTFIAHYTGDVYHLVRFYYNYPDNAAAFYTTSVADGDTVTAPSPGPARTGFAFEGWYLDPAGTLPYDFSSPVVADLNLYARWRSTGGGGNGGGNGGGEWRPPPSNVHHNFLIGDTDGLIRPHADITRAEVASIFLRIISDERRAEFWSLTNPYHDVALHNWFNNAVSTTSNAGLFVGRPSGNFDPNQPITRAELVTVAARFASVVYTGADLFSDIAGHWANAAINAVANAGWIQGQTGLNGTFLPDDPITRAETAAIINRMLNRLPEGLDDLLDGMRTWPDNANPNAWYYLYIQEASNSHTYMRKADGIHEKWVELVADRPWALLQLPTSRPGDIFTTAS